MNQQQVVDLMASSRNSEEWNANADAVKEACGGYPGFWYSAIMLSGLGHRVQQSWLETAVKVLPQNNVNSYTLNPPTPEEIEEIRKNL